MSALDKADGPPPTGLRLSCADGRTLKVAAAVVAVSVTVLQRGLISFSPPLPPPQVRAIGSIRVAPACKLILRFSAPPWGPAESAGARALTARPLHSVLCVGGPVPEVWFTPRRDARGRLSSWAASGFATGDYATSICARPRGAAVDAFVQQLATVLAAVLFEEAGETAPPTAAARSEMLARLRCSLLSSEVMDWSADPWAAGG